MLSLNRYYFERSRYHDAEIKIKAAFGVYELGQAKSSLHHASIYRVHAAIALENGKLDEAAKYVNMQLELLGLHGTPEGEALMESGLLDRAPDAMSPSSWEYDVPYGAFVVLPFHSICRFGFNLYLTAHDVKDQQYPQYLRHAEICFLTALTDLKTARMDARSVGPRSKSSLRCCRLTLSRKGELYYALGNVTNKQAIFLGKAHIYQSLEYYENALLHFQNANANDNHLATGIAKTHYKLATQYIKLQDYKSAMYKTLLTPTDFQITLTRLDIVTTLTKQRNSTPTTPSTTPTSLDSSSNGTRSKH